MPQSHFAKQVRETCRVRGWDRVAAEWKTSTANLSNWASKGIIPSTAKALPAAAFEGVSVDDFLAGRFSDVHKNERDATRRCAAAADLCRYALIKAAELETKGHSQGELVSDKEFSALSRLGDLIRAQATKVATGEVDRLTWGTTVTITPLPNASAESVARQVPQFEVFVNGLLARFERIENGRVVEV
jgi:hypothetical protein